MTHHHPSRSEAGFTLVELLVATTMALVVFAVTLSTLAVFNDTSLTLTHQNDSQNQARLGIDQIVSQLRNVASSSTPPSFVQRATPDDLVFQTISVAYRATTAVRVRYCVPNLAGPATEPLIFQTQPVTATLWSAAQCPDTSGGSSSSILIGNVTNAHRGMGVFTYDGGAGSLGATPNDPTAIRSVGINLFVNPKPGIASSEYELQSSALLRNAQSAPTAAFTWSDGATNTVNLDAGASYSPSGALTDAWSCAPVACSSTASTFTWTNPGSSTTTETVTLTVTDQAGLSSSVSHQVTVP
jgi:type II secretory pathway pseudopilin PulG